MNKMLCGALVLLTLNGPAFAGVGEKDWLVDALRPHGHARSEAQKQADGAFCNSVAMKRGRYDQAVFDRTVMSCIRAHGWRVVRVVKASPSKGGSTSSGIDPITQSGIDAGFAAQNAQSNDETSAAGAAAAAASVGQ